MVESFYYPSRALGARLWVHDIVYEYIHPAFDCAFDLVDDDGTRVLPESLPAGERREISEFILGALLRGLNELDARMWESYEP